MSLSQPDILSLGPCQPLDFELELCPGKLNLEIKLYEPRIEDWAFFEPQASSFFAPWVSGARIHSTWDGHRHYKAIRGGADTTSSTSEPIPASLGVPRQPSKYCSGPMLFNFNIRMEIINPTRLLHLMLGDPTSSQALETELGWVRWDRDLRLMQVVFWLWASNSSSIFMLP